MINLDVASGTRMSFAALWAYVLCALQFPGNPNAKHAEGERSLKELVRMRKEVAMRFGVSAQHLICTSGGTESNALAILGALRGLRAKGIDIRGVEVLVSEGEHASIIELAPILSDWGVTVTTIPLNNMGSLALSDVLRVFTDRTIVVSIATIFGETGAVPPVRDIFMHLRQIKRTLPLILHTDASQAAGYLDVAPQRLAADLVTIDGQKIYGPKGFGILVGPGILALAPLFGGTVVRPGTPPLSLISAFNAALKQVCASRKQRMQAIQAMRNALLAQVLRAWPDARTPSSRDGSQIVPIAFPGVDAEYLAAYLSKKGILVATRSACSEGEEAVAYRRQFGTDARSVIRFSFDHTLTTGQVARLVVVLRSFKKLVDRGIGRTYSEDTTYAS